MAEGEFAQIRQHIEKALDLDIFLIGDHDLFAMLLNAAVMQRDTASLWKYAPLLVEEAVRLDHKLYLAVTHRGWGVLHTLMGEFTEAKEHLEQALVIFQDLETRWQLGRTCFELGELAVVRSDNGEAQKQYISALKLFEEMGASPEAARALAKLESLS